MKIYALPIGNEDCGSSRIRCYRTSKFLPAGYDMEIVKEDCDLKCDVLFIQKKATKEVIELSKKAMSLGVPVVFDSDDDFGVWAGMYELELLRYVSAVTVDTDARKKLIQSYFSGPVFVVPPSIDYVNSDDTRIQIRNHINSIVTFGCDFSIPLAREYLLDVSSEYKLFQISSRGVDGFSFVRWSLNSFIGDLISHDVCFLAHEKNETGMRKCSNRLLTAMSVGIPTIVSDTKSFREVMIEVGHPELVVSSSSEFSSALQNILSKEKREKISSDFIRYSWGKYSPRASALFFTGVIDEIIKAKIQNVVDILLNDERLSVHHYPWSVELFLFILKAKPMKIIDFGTRKGFSSILMAFAIKNTGGTINSYDVWNNETRNNFPAVGSIDEAKSNIKRYGVDNIVNVKNVDFWEWIKNPEKFDLLYLDIHNDGEKILALYEAVKNQISEGSIVLFEGGIKARDEVQWMKQGMVPITSTQWITRYETLSNVFPGLGMINQ